jgi:hypothetical protein
MFQEFQLYITSARILNLESQLINNKTAFILDSFDGRDLGTDQKIRDILKVEIIRKP